VFKIQCGQTLVTLWLAGVDPKSIVCEFYRHGQCAKGFKCKFSHDLSVERKGEKIDIYSDQRDGDVGARFAKLCYISRYCKGQKFGIACCRVRKGQIFHMVDSSFNCEFGRHHGWLGPRKAWESGWIQGHGVQQQQTYRNCKFFPLLTAVLFCCVWKQFLLFSKGLLATGSSNIPGGFCILICLYTAAGNLWLTKPYRNKNAVFRIGLKVDLQLHLCQGDCCNLWLQATP